MKIFAAVLGAILTAGAIFLIGLGMVGRYTDWQHRKETIIRVINQNDHEFSEIHSEFNSQSVEGMKSDLRRMQGIAGQNEEARAVLKTLLEHKPFFALDVDEKRWLSEITPAVSTQQITPMPVIESPQTQLVTPVSYVRLTMDTEVYTRDQRTIALAAGLRLKLIGTQGHDVQIEYEGGAYSIPSAFTKPD